ncbi:hypothetical protein N7453_008237 [Penicillium expansum]|nr:hypothetical protein N7453_008237 [Penicillium expansum]
MKKSDTNTNPRGRARPKALGPLCLKLRFGSLGSISQISSCLQRRHLAPGIHGSANTGSNRLSGRITAIVDGPLPRKIGPESTQCQALGIGAALSPWGRIDYFHLLH